MKEPAYAEAKRNEAAEWEKTQAAMRRLALLRLKSAVEVDASDLLNAYHENEVAADLRYKGKALVIASERTSWTGRM